MGGDSINKQDVGSVLQRLTDLALAVLVIYGIPGVVTSILRLRDVGWVNTMALHFGSLIILSAAYLLRKRIPTTAKALLVIGILFLVGTGSYPTNANAGSGIFFYLVVVVIAAIVFGTRIGLVFLILCTAVLVSSWLAIRAGILDPAIDFNAYVRSDSSWLAKIVTFGGFSALVVVIIGFMRRGLISMIEELALHRSKLEELVKQRSMELEAAQGQLLKQQRLALLGQLTATVSHELRNPLGTVRNSFFTIQENVPAKEGDRVYRALTLAYRNIDRCANIVNELLDFSKRRQLQREDTDLDEWLSGILEEQQLPGGIRLERRHGANITVPIDREVMRRAILNVLTNALQAIDAGGVAEGRVEIETAVERDRVRISITDNGCGMSSEIVPQIFEPLYSTKDFGVGLGMPIVQGAISDHGGEMEVQSEEGRGTTITLWLPNG